MSNALLRIQSNEMITAKNNNKTGFLNESWPCIPSGQAEQASFLKVIGNKNLEQTLNHLTSQNDTKLSHWDNNDNLYSVFLKNN